MPSAAFYRRSSVASADASPSGLRAAVAKNNADAAFLYGDIQPRQSQPQCIYYSSQDEPPQYLYSSSQDATPRDMDNPRQDAGSFANGDHSGQRGSCLRGGAGGSSFGGYLSKHRSHIKYTQDGRGLVAKTEGHYPGLGPGGSDLRTETNGFYSTSTGYQVEHTEYADGNGGIVVGESRSGAASGRFKDIMGGMSGSGSRSSRYIDEGSSRSASRSRNPAAYGPDPRALEYGGSRSQSSRYGNDSRGRSRSRSTSRSRYEPVESRSRSRAGGGYVIGEASDSRSRGRLQSASRSSSRYMSARELPPPPPREASRSRGDGYGESRSGWKPRAKEVIMKYTRESRRGESRRSHGADYGYEPVRPAASTRESRYTAPLARVFGSASRSGSSQRVYPGDCASRSSYYTASRSSRSNTSTVVPYSSGFGSTRSVPRESSRSRTRDESRRRSPSRHRSSSRSRGW